VGGMLGQTIDADGVVLAVIRSGRTTSIVMVGVCLMKGWLIASSSGSSKTV